MIPTDPPIIYHRERLRARVCGNRTRDLGSLRPANKTEISANSVRPLYERKNGIAGTYREFCGYWWFPRGAARLLLNAPLIAPLDPLW